MADEKVFQSLSERDRQAANALTVTDSDNRGDVLLAAAILLSHANQYYTAQLLKKVALEYGGKFVQQFLGSVREAGDGSQHRR